MLCRPAHAPPAFWRWFRIPRTLLAVLGVTSVMWLLAAASYTIIANGGFELSLFPSARHGRGPAWLEPRLLWPIGLCGLYVLVRMPVYRVAKRVFFARLRRADFEVCQSCAYPLHGLPSLHVCPECGRAYQRDATRRAWQRWMDSADEAWPDWDIST